MFSFPAPEHISASWPVLFLLKSGLSSQPCQRSKSFRCWKSCLAVWPSECSKSWNEDPMFSFLLLSIYRLLGRLLLKHWLHLHLVKYSKYWKTHYVFLWPPSAQMPVVCSHVLFLFAWGYIKKPPGTISFCSNLHFLLRLSYIERWCKCFMFVSGLRVLKSLDDMQYVRFFPLLRPPYFCSYTTTPRPSQISKRGLGT